MSNPLVQVVGSVPDMDGAPVMVGFDRCAVTIGVYRIGATELQELGRLVTEARAKAQDNGFALTESGGAL